MIKYKTPILFLFTITLFSCSTDNSNTEAPEINPALNLDEVMEDVIEEIETEEVAPVEEEEVEAVIEVNPDDLPQIGWDLMDSESFGDLKLRMDSATVVRLIGQPDSKTVEVYWGADGGHHSDWIYKRYGLTLGMNRIEEHPNPAYIKKQVDRMELSNLSPLCTSRSICMGSSSTEVIKAYAGTIEESDPENECLVAGTVYGGLIFTFENKKLVSLFLGAAAE